MSLEETRETKQNMKNHIRRDPSLQGNEEEFINYMMEAMHPVETQWTVEVHGLSMYHLGTKYTEVESSDVAKIEAAAKRIWSEIQLPSRTIYVWPIPEGHPRIVVILEVHNPVRQQIMEGVVTLRRVFHHNVDDIDVQAAYHQINDRALDILEQADLRRECKPWDISKCIIRANGYYLRPDESPRLRSGTLIDIWIREPIMQSEQTEGVSLMQRAAITTSTRSVEVNEGEDEEIVHTFHISTHYRLISIDTTPEMEIIPRVNRAWNFPGDGPIISIYGVFEPPEDLATTASATWILEFANDAARRAMTDDKLVLVDVQLKAPNQPGQSETIRKVMWLRAWMTRTDILHALSAQDYCADAYSYCTVSKNNAIWPDQDTARREIAHGDYIKLAIEGQESLTVQDLLNILHSQEQADSMRYLYQDSPEQESPRTTGRRSTTRSRSRNRDPDGSSEAEDNREAIEPHVLDRWCAHGRSVEQSLTERKTISISNLEGIRLQEMDIGCDAKETEKLQNLCNQQMLSTIFPDSIVENLNPIAQEWVHRYPYKEGLQQETTYIYTDGSAQGGVETEEHYKHAAFAVVLYAENQEGGGRHLVGWTGAQVEKDPGQPGYLGANAADAANAERSAILQALLLVSQRIHLGRHEICFDNQAAGFGAEGVWRTDKDCRLASTIRLFTHLLQQKGAQIEFQHVKAHSNHPQNDVVDQCAKAINMGWTKGSPILAASEILCPEWLHQMILCDGANSIFPAMVNTKMVWTHQEKVAPMTLQIPLVPEQVEVDYGSSRKEHNALIHVATYNVLTLRPWMAKNSDVEVDATFLHKAAYLAQQVTAQRINIAGIQEARGYQSGIIRHDGIYRIVAKGTDRGTHGCELWINLEEPMVILAGKKVYPDPNKITVLYDSHTLLLARVQLPEMNLVIGSAHAPQTGVDRQQREEWWSNAKYQIQKTKNADHVIIMGDFNATMPTALPPYTGNNQCKKSNDNSVFLEDFLQTTQTWAPSTFNECHQGDTHTWTHPTGAVSRLDYILIDDQVKQQNCQSYPLPDLDAGNPTEDHQAVGLTVQLKWESTGRQRSRRSIDWYEVAQPRNAEKVRQCIASVPQCAWGVDIHDHMQFVQDAVHEQLSEHFTTKKKPVVKPYITEGTWCIREKKLLLRRALREMHREEEKVISVMIAFGKWSAKRATPTKLAVLTIAELLLANQLRTTSKQLKTMRLSMRSTGKIGGLHASKRDHGDGRSGSR